MQSHLPYCKRKPEYEAFGGNTRREVSSGQQHQQGQQRCSHCNELFTRLKTHLHYCKQKPDSEDHTGNGRMQESSGNQRCPYCNELFIRVKTHLHYCKQKPGGQGFDQQRCPHCNGLFIRLKTHLHYCKHKAYPEEGDVNSPREKSSGKQRCPHCKELFVRLATHLLYCKQKPNCEKPEASCRMTDDARNQQCPHCNKLFKCLKKHLPFCKGDPDRDDPGECCRRGTRSCDTRGPCGEELDTSCRWTDYSSPRDPRGEEFGIADYFGKYNPFDVELEPGYRGTVSSYAQDTGCEEKLGAHGRETVSSYARDSDSIPDSVSFYAHHSENEEADAYSRGTFSSVARDSDSEELYASSRTADSADNDDDIDDRATLEHRLSARLRDARVDQKQPEQVTETVDTIKRVVLDTLNGDGCILSSVRWKASNSGPCCELQKVSWTKSI